MENNYKKEIEKVLPIPFYYQIQLFIEEKIKNEEWKVGDFIPSERELCLDFDVSRITVRKALDSLVSRGILKKVRGKGTLILDNQNTSKLRDKLFSFYQYLTDKGFDIKIKVTNFKRIKPVKFVRNILKLNLDEEIFETDRLRIINNEPWYYETTYLPVRYCPNLLKEDLKTDSILKIIIEKSKIRAFKSRIYLYSSIAKEKDCQLLNINQGYPLQIFENIDYLDERTPIAYSINFCRSDKIIFDFEINQDEIIKFVQKDRADSGTYFNSQN